MKHTVLMKYNAPPLEPQQAADSNVAACAQDPRRRACSRHSWPLLLPPNKTLPAAQQNPRSHTDQTLQPMGNQSGALSRLTRTQPQPVLSLSLAYEPFFMPPPARAQAYYAVCAPQSVAGHHNVVCATRCCDYSGASPDLNVVDASSGRHLVYCTIGMDAGRRDAHAAATLTG